MWRTMPRLRPSEKSRWLFFTSGCILPGELRLSHAVDRLTVADSCLMLFTHRLTGVVRSDAVRRDTLLPMLHRQKHRPAATG